MWGSVKKDTGIINYVEELVLVLIIVCVYSIAITIMPFPFYTDEVGYWANAAYMVGIDWNEVMSKIGYYGFGYSFFLVPLFLIENAKARYVAALMLNILFVVIAFWVLRRIVLDVDNNKEKVIDKRTANFCAFVASFYPPLIVYAHTCMAEICIYLFVVLLIRGIQQYVKMNTLTNGLFVSIVSFLLVSIHLRNAIFLLCTVFFLLLLRNRKVIWVISGIIIALVFSLMIKNYFIDVLYTSKVTNAHVSYNDDVLARTWFLNSLGDIDWWIRYLINLISRMVYFCLSTLFLMPYAVYKAINTFKKKHYKFDLLLIILAFASIAYDALVTFCGPNFRLDGIFYGRYIECIMPVYVAIALVDVYREKAKPNKKYLMAVFLLLLGEKIAHNYIVNDCLSLNYSEFLPLQTVGIAWSLISKPEDVVIHYTFIVALCCCLISFVIYAIIKNGSNRLRVIFVLWVLFAYMGWWAFGLNLNEETELTKFSRMHRYERICDIAAFLDEYPSENVNYLYEDNSYGPEYYDMYTLQYILGNKLIKTVSYEDKDEFEGELLIVSYSNPEFWEIKRESNILYENNYYLVVKK